MKNLLKKIRIFIVHHLREFLQVNRDWDRIQADLRRIMEKDLDRDEQYPLVDKQALPDESRYGTLHLGGYYYYDEPTLGGVQVFFVVGDAGYVNGPHETETHAKHFLISPNQEVRVYWQVKI